MQTDITTEFLAEWPGCEIGRHGVKIERFAGETAVNCHKPKCELCGWRLVEGRMVGSIGEPEQFEVHWHRAVIDVRDSDDMDDGQNDLVELKICDVCADAWENEVRR